jgi:CubicO group peptidase (beta-lactamase class C family)
LSHQAGIPVIDDVPVGAILDWEVMAAAVAHQEPMWAPGERHGYHGTSFGWLVGQPVRRASGTTLSDFVQREVFDRLGVEGFIGTPTEQHHRMASLVWGRPAHGGAAPPPGSAAGGAPSLAQRMFAPVLPPLAPAMNDAAFRRASIPFTGAAVTARTLAAIFGELSCDGGRLVSATVARDLGDVQIDGDDAVFGVPISRTLGYERTPVWADDGRPAHCWGSPGGGGVVTFADPVARIGFAYVNNAAWSGTGEDPRAARLTRALYSCL